MIQQVNFNSSLKNVPHTTKKEYFLKMNHQAKIFVRNIRWAVCIFLSQDKSKDKEKKERYGFNSQKNPDPQPLVEPFVDEVYDVIKNIKFKQKTNEIQKQFKEKTINKIEECDKLLI